MATPENKQRVLFIDRDGTLIVEPPVDFQVDSLEKLELVPGALRAMHFIASHFPFKLVMVTNQDGLGTDSFPEDTFWPAHNKMLRTFENEGVTFDDIIIDRTFEHENKPTRKPGTALLGEYLSGNYDLENSFVIGDRLSDVQLAKNLGCKAILLRNIDDVATEISEKGLSETITSFGTYTREQLLQLCAGCEMHSTHPIAVSITAAAETQGLQPEKPDTLEEIPGQGIAATIGGRQVLCGNRQLMERFGVPAQGEAQVFLAVDGSLEGSFRIADSIKEDAAEAVSTLKKLGLHAAVLTGDTAAGAEQVARELGITEVHAGLLPQQKLEALQNIRSRHGAVMFVGDGINDAPVLAGADVGAAMGSGADAAMEAADAVFMTSAAASIPEAVRIARRTYRVAVQNVVVALAIKLVVMVLGLLGFASMWLAVFADSGVALLCVLNSIRLLYERKEKQDDRT